ncbi:hypothetical protein DFH06DRAFT_1326686 [Mycena polygramma]|nr:hypothetical protein DFH06DRAFT_1326686 [Mycena polygramma]
MERYKQDWLDAADDPDNFYTMQAKHFIVKAGWDPQFSKHGEGSLDFESETPGPTEGDLKVFVSPTDDTEEKGVYLRELRMKIGQWYQYHYRKILAADELEVGVDALLAGFGGHDPIKKMTTPPLESFDAEMAMLMQKLKDSLLQEKPSDVAMRNRVTREQWALGDEVFRQCIQLEIEAKHAKDMADYEAAVEGENNSADSRTPKEFHKLLTNAAATLDPLADSLSRRYGMAVMILLASPIPDKGGSIEVLRQLKCWEDKRPHAKIVAADGPSRVQWSGNEYVAIRDADVFNAMYGMSSALLRMDDMDCEGNAGSDEDSDEEDEEDDDEEQLAVMVEKGKGKEKGRGKEKGKEKTQGKGEPQRERKKFASPAKTSAKTMPPRPKPKAAYKGAANGNVVPHDGGAAPPNDSGAIPPPLLNDGGAIPPPPANDSGTIPPEDGGAAPPNDGGTIPPANDPGTIPPPPPPPPPSNDGNEGDAEKERKDMPPSPWPLIGARWAPELRRVYPWWEAEAARFGDG